MNTEQIKAAAERREIVLALVQKHGPMSALAASVMLRRSPRWWRLPRDTSTAQDAVANDFRVLNTKRSLRTFYVKHANEENKIHRLLVADRRAGQ